MHAGLVIRVPRVSKPGVPLKSYADGTYFKLYLLDVGLLGAATHLDAVALVDGDRQFTEYKGAYAEQFACQHLLAYSGHAPYYWSADGKEAKGEVDFIVERDGAPRRGASLACGAPRLVEVEGLIALLATILQELVAAVEVGHAPANKTTSMLPKG